MTDSPNSSTGREQPGVWSLYYDLQGVSLNSDGQGNPAWRRAADRYSVIRGDGIETAVIVYVAVYEVNGRTGEHRGRDWRGRAVRLVPTTTPVEQS